MAYIEMTIKVFEESTVFAGERALGKEAHSNGITTRVATVEQAKRLAQELVNYASALARENPDATAVADSIAREGEPTVQRMIIAGDPDKTIFSKTNMDAFWGKRRF